MNVHTSILKAIVSLMSKQTKFSALIPEMLSDNPDSQESPQNRDYFWHSFFLLSPEFTVLQTTLSGSYSIKAVRELVAKCIETIGSGESTIVSSLRRRNASYLLVQIFEALWPRLRIGTFGVDALTILCGIDQSQPFFRSLFDSILPQSDPSPALVLLSLLAATRDIDTNALTDFFSERCEDIVRYCMKASDLHLLLFSMLLQFDRPSGPFIRHFRPASDSQDRVFGGPDFKALLANEINLIARASQLFVCCRRTPPSFRRKTTSTPQAAQIGLFNPSDMQLPMFFALFEPFVDAAVLCFFQLVSVTTDAALLSAALVLLSHLVASPAVQHSGDRLKMMLISFEFLFDGAPGAAAVPFDCQQFRSCFNSSVCDARECTVGAMCLELVSFLLELPRAVLPVSHIIGRIVYTIVSRFIHYRGNHNADWARLFGRIFSFCNKSSRLTCEFNGYSIATVAMCSSFRAALFKKDDGFIHLVQALAKEPSIALCEYRPPDAFNMSSDFMKKCQAHVRKLCQAARPEFAEIQFQQVEAVIPEIRVDEVPTDDFPEMDNLSECPTFTEFFHIYARQHCESVQALLQYAISHFVN
jgi:hypothetical protein